MNNWLSGFSGHAKITCVIGNQLHSKENTYTGVTCLVNYNENRINLMGEFLITRKPRVYHLENYLSTINFIFDYYRSDACNFSLNLFNIC